MVHWELQINNTIKYDRDYRALSLSLDWSYPDPYVHCSNTIFSKPLFRYESPNRKFLRDPTYDLEMVALLMPYGPLCPLCCSLEKEILHCPLTKPTSPVLLWSILDIISDSPLIFRKTTMPWFLVSLSLFFVFVFK